MIVGFEFAFWSDADISILAFSMFTFSVNEKIEKRRVFKSPSIITLSSSVEAFCWRVTKLTTALFSLLVNSTLEFP